MESVQVENIEELEGLEHGIIGPIPILKLEVPRGSFGSVEGAKYSTLLKSRTELTC
jgi:hypothetical protein